jgi:hypothetical protein
MILLLAWGVGMGAGTAPAAPPVDPCTLIRRTRVDESGTPRTRNDPTLTPRTRVDESTVSRTRPDGCC